MNSEGKISSHQAISPLFKYVKMCTASNNDMIVIFVEIVKPFDKILPMGIFMQFIKYHKRLITWDMNREDVFNERLSRQNKGSDADLDPN